MSLFDSVMADTVGAVWRASSGTVDPWTKQELIDQESAAVQQASAGTIDSQAAADQAGTDVTDALSSFSLGGGDPVGADPSQYSVSVPSLQAEIDTVKSATNDTGAGCGITNLAGCFHLPRWAIVAAVGLVVVVAGGYLIHVAAEAKAVVS